MNAFEPLWAADFGDFVKVVLIILFIVVPAIGQLLAKMKRMQPPGGGVRPPNPPMPAQADNVGDEIEEFMRRAAQRRGQKGQRPRAQRQPAAEEPVQAELVERPVGGQVTEHTKKYLDQSEFSRRTSQLGGEVAQADRQIDQRLHQKFDRAVSQLAAVPGEAAVPPVAIALPDLAASIADLPVASPAGLVLLLTNPDSLRQAIVLNEILHRPEERWG